MDPRPPIDWIALSLLPGIGPLALQTALERYGDPGEVAYRVPAGSLALLPRVRRGSAEKIRVARRSLRREAEREWKRCVRLGVRVLSRADEGYPAALAELPDAPVVLFMKGELGPGVLRVAIVGSRTPTGYGRRLAAGLASGLAARGIEVVSGGARGIDTCAHRGALDDGGRTVVVSGTGLAHPYPPENAELFERVAGSGAVLSELTMETPAHPGNFPRRNRLVSGLAQAVVVVEAAERSGSLITARLGLEQGREVLAVPGPVSSGRSVGCHRLIQDGAKLVQNLDDILEELPPLFRNAAAPDPSREQAPNLADLSSDEDTILRLLDTVEPRHLDEIAENAPLGISRLQAALLGLEVRGAVEQCPGRYYLSRLRRDP